jgi:hypothetical protein
VKFVSRVLEEVLSSRIERPRVNFVDYLYTQLDEAEHEKYMYAFKQVFGLKHEVLLEFPGSLGEMMNWDGTWFFCWPLFDFITGKWPSPWSSGVGIIHGGGEGSEQSLTYQGVALRVTVVYRLD